MSCGPCDEKRRRDRMSRGEFIGTGAAAAAVASMGPMAAAAQSQGACGKPTRCGPDADEEWSVSASVLQVLWGDIFPRFVAYRWKNGGAYPGPIGTSPPGEIPPDVLVLAIHSYLGSMDPADLNVPCTAPDPNDPNDNWDCDFNIPACLNSFEKRVKYVLDYLTDTSLNHIPIRLLGIGGFDFILSDAGLDLIAPRRPDQAELLRFYEFRPSGRSTIGLPDYLDDKMDLAFDVQAPVGPSQIWLDDQAFTQIHIDVGSGCTLSDLADCLDAQVAGDDDPGLREEGMIPPVRRISIRSLVGATSKVRCWQLEGAVYRGILEQLPRVVATIWHEEVTGCTGGQSYHARFNDPPTHPDGVREVFKERLETSLPGPTEMVFQTGAVGDVMVSNRGLILPAPGAAPSLDDMFTAIKDGRAGNPVFTDSRRPPSL